MISVGTDIIKIKRLENTTFHEKVFHKSEMRRNNIEHLAGIFAVKEAFFKALGISPSWLEVIVKHKNNGQPYLEFSNELKLKIDSCSCSISHDGGYTIATVILELRQ